MQYEATIGLEIHAQLKTKSKMFCACDNDAEGKEPNTVTCPVCMGHPGTLPVANRQALEWTFLLGLALNAEIAPQFNFERKQYFYPDLPKAYQITSQTTPPLIGGSLEIDGKKFTIEHIHLEEDAGKLIHKDGYSLVDLNRAGTPLLEIVTDPTFSTPQEAKHFMQELRLILRYLNISDADMEKGHLRADANISIKPKGRKKLGKKTEVKNMNSFTAVERALEHEIKRQTEILESGGEIEQETRGWDEKKQETFSQRSKEQAHDYRYFPEPDIPPVRAETAQNTNRTKHKQTFNLEDLKQQIPELPAKKRGRYENEYGLSAKDAETLVADKDIAVFFEASVEARHGVPRRPEVIKKITNWILGEILRVMNETNISIADIKITPERLTDLVLLVEDGTITGTIAKEIFSKMIELNADAKTVIEKEGYKQVSDARELESIVEKIIVANPGPVADFKAGKEIALKFLVGQVMKATKGQANPQKVESILKQMLM